MYERSIVFRENVKQKVILVLLFLSDDYRRNTYIWIHHVQAMFLTTIADKSQYTKQQKKKVRNTKKKGIKKNSSSSYAFMYT